MMLPKVSKEVCENVYNEATRGNIQSVLKYSIEKVNELQRENPELCECIDGYATEASGGDRELYGRIYFGVVVILNIINTQLEVDDLKSWN